MKKNLNEFIDINNARNVLKSNGLVYLSHIIYQNRTVNIGKRMYITKKQFENCVKKDLARAN
jgi:hypothetical protein